MHLLMAAAVLGAFLLSLILVGGGGGDAPTLDDLENDEEFQAMQSEWREMKARRAEEGRGVPKIAGGNGVRMSGGSVDPEQTRTIETKVAGAYYPDDNEEDESAVVATLTDPLVCAGVGGGLVFGLIGGVAWLALGMFGGSEPEPEPEPPSDDDLIRFD